MKEDSVISIQLIYSISLLTLVLSTSMSCGSQGKSGSGEWTTLTVPDDFSDISEAVASLENGGAVYVKAKSNCYEISEPVHLSKSRTSLIGQNDPCLRLADGANVPVILVGSNSETVKEEEQIFDIRIRGFRIDGNRENQRSSDEYDEAPSMPNIKINGIAVRGSQRVYLTDLVIENTRSGGIVISQESRKVTVQDVTLRRNFYDGLAISGSHEIIAENFISEYNDYSGVSIDTGSSLLDIQNASLANNGDNGLFVRHTANSDFTNLQISDNCNFGIYLSHAQDDGSEGVKGLHFDKNEVYNNGNAGLILESDAGKGSTDITVENSIFSGNAGEAIVESNDITSTNNSFQQVEEKGPRRSCSPR